MERTKRIQRPAALDYREHLEQRFRGSAHQVHMCDMSAIGSVSADERKPYECIDGIAVINISGVLSNDAYWWDETDYRDIIEECSMAADDSDVQGILARFNTPGGGTENAFETAMVLRDIAKKKRMWAVADTVAFSAGYLLACTAERIFVPPVTGGVGSVGVYGVHMDYSKMLADAGIKPTIISAGEGKTDGNPYQPLSPEALDRIRAEIERLYGEFVSVVASCRKKSAEQIRKLGAYPFLGSNAGLASGLADAIGNPDTALLEMRAAIAAEQRKAISFGASASAERISTQKENTMPQQEADAAKTPQSEASNPAAPPPVVPAGASAVTESPKANAQDSSFTLEMSEENQQLCAIFGDETLALDFNRKRMKPAEVRKALATRRATEDEGNEVRAQVLPHEGTQANLANKKSNGLIAACERIAAQLKGGK